MVTKRLAGGALAILAASALTFGATGTAFAASTKTCDSTAVNGGLTRTTTQTSACNSNSDTGQTSTVTNKSGHAPPGAQ